MTATAMQILASYSTNAGRETAPGRVILAERKHPLHPFVTWWENRENGVRYWGHYFEREDEARTDFIGRCQRGY